MTRELYSMDRGDNFLVGLRENSSAADMIERNLTPI